MAATSLKAAQIAQLLSHREHSNAVSVPFSHRVPRLRTALPLTRRGPAPTNVYSDVEADEDLWQIADRDQWYLAKFAAVDQPDWNPATFVRSSELAPGVKEVVLSIEISRERVPLRSAYKHVGQTAAVRVNGGAEQTVLPTCPPFSNALLRDGLLRVRNDMTAGETKTVVEDGSVKAELSVMVKKETAPELYAAGETDLFEVGPFQGTGMELRGPINAVFAYPTVVIFCEGDGIAAARALVAAGPDSAGLNFKLRQDAPNQASLCYNQEHEEWLEKYGVRVITSTRGTFQDMFDDDDTLVYEPETTAAIILTGNENEEAEAVAADVCKEAEISLVVKQSLQREPTAYLKDGKRLADLA